MLCQKNRGCAAQHQISYQMLLVDARTFAAHQPHERGNRPEGQWALSDSYMEAQAAQQGLGLAYVPVERVADDLEHGKLIRVLLCYSLRIAGLFLYYPHRNVSPALWMVIDTLKI